MSNGLFRWLTFACVAGWAGYLHAFERSEVERSVVRIFNVTPSGFSSGSGTVVDALGHVLTNHHVIDGDGSHHLIVDSEFINKEIPAQKIVGQSAEKDLALIRVPGLGLPTASLFTGELEAGSSPPVFAMGYPGAADRASPARSASLTDGILSHPFIGVDWPVTVLQHSATVSGGNSGGPLFDDCGRVIGVNTQRPHVMTSGGRVPNNSAINWASHIKESINLLRQHDIDFQSDDARCLPPSPSGGHDPETARKADEALGAAGTAGETAEEAKEAAAEAGALAEEAVQRIGVQNAVVALLAVVALAALGLALYLPRQALARVAARVAAPLSRLSRSGRRAGPPRQPDGAPARDVAVALTGFDARGMKVAIALSRGDLDRRGGGFTVGRHPLLVDRTLDDGRLSRRHARFARLDGSVCVEDLNSSNGTRVNGKQCTPFQPVPIRPGDTVHVGDVELRVSK